MSDLHRALTEAIRDRHNLSTDGHAFDDCPDPVCAALDAVIEAEQNAATPGIAALPALDVQDEP